MTKHLSAEQQFQQPNEVAEISRVKPWFAIDGDANLRVNYPLNKKSLVYDVGGYKGDWAEDIYSRYGCTIEVFEPVKEFIATLKKRFLNNSDVHIHEFGLGGKTRTLTISLDLASSSVFKANQAKKTEDISIMAVREFSQQQHHSKIDLIKMNIEGGEFELLHHLIDTGLIAHITNLQIQFHGFVPNAEKERLKLQELLQKTHSLTYNYLFIWENWSLKHA